MSDIIFSLHKNKNKVRVHSISLCCELCVSTNQQWCLWLRYVSLLPCWSLVQTQRRSPKRCVLTPGGWAETPFPKDSYSERPRLRTKWRVWPTKTVAAQAFGTSSSKNPVRQHSHFNSSLSSSFIIHLQTSNHIKIMRFVSWQITILFFFSSWKVSPHGFG